MGHLNADGRRGPRVTFQIDKRVDGGVIRVMDRSAGTVLREIPVREFVAFAKEHKNVKAFLLGRL